MTVQIPIFSIHNDEELYPNPSEFKPGDNCL